ncbi:hypothetical protein FOL47_007430 [Perkinsus chesapeaki]|uniref:Uncharacterized protein n=1 Tax=Perkinsus chesapeaki TaxID=330153 RepID=A0A7J6MVM5_PERCH|nr:hypothetical protein FOL47_007430 [Perkinsus chesapeaki]
MVPALLLIPISAMASEITLQDFLECNGPGFDPRWRHLSTLIKDYYSHPDLVNTSYVSSLSTDLTQGGAFERDLLPTLRIFYLHLAHSDSTSLNIPFESVGCVLGFFTAAVWLLFDLGEYPGILPTLLKYQYVREVGFFKETNNWDTFPYIDFIVSTADGRLEHYQRSDSEYPDLTYTTPSPIHGRGKALGSSANVLVVGEHLSLSTEVTSAIAALFPDRKFNFDYHGHYAYCDGNLQDCEDPCNRVMGKFVSQNHRRREGISGDGGVTVEELSSKLQSCLPRNVQWDLVIATRSAGIALAVWRAFNNSAILAVSGGPMTFGILEEDEAAVLEFVKSRPQNVVYGEVGSSLSDAMSRLLNVSSSSVPSVAFYTGPGADVENPRTGLEGIIVFRPRWFAACNQGALFSSMMSKLFEQADLAGRLKILQHDSSERVSYQRLASERPIVVLFPDNTSKRSLYELYAMCLPVLVPTTELAVEVLRGTLAFNEMQDIFKPKAFSNLSGIFIEGQNDIYGFVRAYEASEFSRYPNLIRFGSISEMIAIAKDTRRVEDAARGVCKYVREVVQLAAAQFYHGALDGVFSGHDSECM